MPHDLDLRHRRRAARGKLVLTVVVVAVVGYLVAGLVAGAFDDLLQGLR